MRYRGLLAFAASSLLAIATPAMAQWSGQSGAMFNDWLGAHPQVARELQSDPARLYDPSWREQHPDLVEAMRERPDVWQGLTEQSPNFYDARFQEFLSNHPNVARDLASNSTLLYNRNFLDAHPSLAEYLSRHGSPWRVMSASFGGSEWGDYDDNHQWHDYYWWHENHPDWFWSHHPEWAANEPAWHDYDGDYDDSHVWHDRNWWAQNHPDYVRQHHQDWGDWDDNRQWHDRDWWVQNRANVVASRHPNWMQQQQAYQQALKTEQVKAQQQRAAFADAQAKQNADLQARKSGYEQNQAKQADLEARKRAGYEQNQQQQADLEARKRAGYEQNQQQQADLEARKRAGYEQNQAKQAELNAQRQKGAEQNAMKQSDMRAEQAKIAEQKQAAMEAQSRANANNNANHNEMMNRTNEAEVHKMAPIHPGYAHPEHGIANGGEPAMHRPAPPIAAAPSAPQNDAEMARQNMKMHHGAEPAPQGAVHESKELNNGAPAVNH